MVANDAECYFRFLVECLQCRALFGSRDHRIIPGMYSKILKDDTMIDACPKCKKEVSVHLTTGED